MSNTTSPLDPAQFFLAHKDQLERYHASLCEDSDSQVQYAANREELIGLLQTNQHASAFTSAELGLIAMLCNILLN